MRPLAGAGTGAVAAKLVAAGPSEASGAAQAAPTETFRKSRREVFCFMMTSCFECRRGLRRSFYRHTINVPLAAQGNPGAAAPSPGNPCGLPGSRLAGSELRKLRDIDLRTEHFFRLLQLFPSDRFSGISRVAAQHGA